MMPIFQVDLKIIYPEIRIWVIQLARTVLTSDAEVIAIFSIRWRRRIRLDNDRLVCVFGDCGVAHYTFDTIVGVFGLQQA